MKFPAPHQPRLTPGVQFVRDKPATHSIVSRDMALAILDWLGISPNSPVAVELVCRHQKRSHWGEENWFARVELVLAYPEAVQPRNIGPDDRRAAQLHALLDTLGWPEEVTREALLSACEPGSLIGAWLRYGGARRPLAALLGRLGYAPHRNPQDARGRWLRNGRQVKVYRRRTAEAER